MPPPQKVCNNSKRPQPLPHQIHWEAYCQATKRQLKQDQSFIQQTFPGHPSTAKNAATHRRRKNKRHAVAVFKELPVQCGRQTRKQELKDMQGSLETEQSAGVEVANSDGKT